MKKIVAREINLTRCKCGQIATIEIFSQENNARFFCKKCAENLGDLFFEKEINPSYESNLNSVSIVPGFGSGISRFARFGKPHGYKSKFDRQLEKNPTVAAFDHSADEIYYRQLIKEFKQSDFKKVRGQYGDRMLVVEYDGEEIYLTELKTPLFIKKGKKTIFYFS